MENGKAFLGTGWAFPPTFHAAAKGAVMVSAEEDIKQSLRILLSTIPRERVMQPTFGCDLRRFVFEIINQSTLTDIKDVITRATLLFEPRIILDLITIEEGSARQPGHPFVPDGVLNVGLYYTVVATNTRSNMVYPLYLSQATSVGGRA
jgi:phage baseplate assembly protein W